MAKIYADLIRKGFKTLEDVPDKLKEAVKLFWKVMTDVFSVLHKNLIQKGSERNGSYLCNPYH